MTVGLEGAHPQLLGQGLAVVGFRLLTRRRMALRCDLAEEPDMCLLREVEGRVAGCEGAVRIAGLGKMGKQTDSDPPQPVWIVQGLGKGLGVL